MKHGDVRAAIDIGTNSTRLAVARVHEGVLHRVDTHLRAPRLGEGVDDTGRLSPKAVERTVDALRDLARTARAAGARHIAVVGTSALRDAANRDVFIGRVRDELGLAVTVLTGDEEAALGFFGAVQGADAAAGIVFTLDVGGGSTELVRGTTDGTMDAALSVDVGVVRMTESYVHTDPVSDADWRALSAAVCAGLEPLTQLVDERERRGPGTVFALGGTATTLAAMDQRLVHYDPRLIHAYRLSRARVGRFAATLRDIPVAARRDWPGLAPERADVILAGAVILDAALGRIGADAVIVSESDLLTALVLRDEFHPASP